MKHDKLKNVKSKNSNEILHFVGVCFLSAGTATAAILLCGSAAALQLANPYGCFVFTSYLILAVNSFVLSWMITRKRRKQWLYTGILTGIGVFSFVSCVSILFNMFSPGLHLVPRILTCMISGMIGAYISLHKKRKKRG